MTASISTWSSTLWVDLDINVLVEGADVPVRLGLAGLLRSFWMAGLADNSSVFGTGTMFSPMPCTRSNAHRSTSHSDACIWWQLTVRGHLKAVEPIVVLLEGIGALLPQPLKHLHVAI